MKDKAKLLVAQGCQLIFAQPGKLCVSEADAAGVHRDITGDAVEQRGLSGAGGPHHRDKLPLSHGERDSFQDLVGGLSHLVAFVQIFDS